MGRALIVPTGEPCITAARASPQGRIAPPRRRLGHPDDSGCRASGGRAVGVQSAAAGHGGRPGEDVERAAGLHGSAPEADYEGWLTELVPTARVEVWEPPSSAAAKRGRKRRQNRDEPRAPRHTRFPQRGMQSPTLTLALSAGSATVAKQSCNAGTAGPHANVAELTAGADTVQVARAVVATCATSPHREKRKAPSARELSTRRIQLRYRNFGRGGTF
jgi:hypothetical protein